MNLSEITVVVPVWQCADRLQMHFEVVRRLAEAGCSTVWVASQSDDNSHQIAKEQSAKIGGRYFLTPRGLYDSWNKGIQESRTPYTYISTVGESILQEGLAHLFDLIRRLEADIVFSPPIAPQNKESLSQILQWPVFLNAQKLKKFDQRVLPTTIAALIQYTSGFSCLLGSFSSCLCRTAFMQSYPFPTQFHHYGDTGWFCMNLGHSRLVYSHKAVADFQIHNAPQRAIDHAHQRVFLRLIRRCLHSKESYLLGLALLKYELFIRYLNSKRGVRPKRYWYKNPKVLYIRILRGMWDIYIKLLAWRFSLVFGSHRL